MVQENDGSPASEIKRLSSLNPDGLISDLGEKNKGLNEIAPNIAPHVVATQTRGLGYLNSKVPNQGSQLFEDEYDPPKNDEDKFESHYKNVSDPVSILDHVANGTLHQGHMDTLKTVYPALHQEMKGKLLEGLADMQASGKTLPYHIRQSASLFLGQPLDSTMTLPAAMAIIQANAGAQMQSQGPGKGQKQRSTSAKTLDQIDKTNSLYQTADQALAARRLKQD